MARAGACMIGRSRLHRQVSAPARRQALAPQVWGRMAMTLEPRSLLEGCSMPRCGPLCRPRGRRRTCRRRPRAAPSWSAPARLRPRWRGPSRTTGPARSQAWSSPATATPSPASGSRSSRPPIPVPDASRRGGGPAHPRAGPGPRPGRSRAVPDLRRRLGAAGAAGAGADARRQAGGQPRRCSRPARRSAR